MTINHLTTQTQDAEAKELLKQHAEARGFLQTLRSIIYNTGYAAPVLDGSIFARPVTGELSLTIASTKIKEFDLGFMQPGEPSTLYALIAFQVAARSSLYIVKMEQEARWSKEKVLELLQEAMEILETPEATKRQGELRL